MATTKNLGQVAGVHIGSIPPENTILIWYDNTPSQNCHKVYDTAKKRKRKMTSNFLMPLLLLKRSTQIL